MPDYTDTPGYKPPEKEVHQRLHDEHEQKQVVRRSAAERFEKAHAKEGPGERLAQKMELTPAQQEMRAKREAARAEDKKQADKPYDDKKYAEIQKNSQHPSR